VKISFQNSTAPPSSGGTVNGDSAAEMRPAKEDSAINRKVATIVSWNLVTRARYSHPKIDPL
jgi:hypothetical protein